MALAVMALGLFSCADEPDKYEVASGLPSVSYVRCLSTEIEGTNDDPDMHYTNGELVTEASPQSIVCLVEGYSQLELHHRQHPHRANPPLGTRNSYRQDLHDYQGPGYCDL